jgi:hypothetical protein
MIEDGIDPDAGGYVTLYCSHAAVQAGKKQMGQSRDPPQPATLGTSAFTGAGGGASEQAAEQATTTSFARLWLSATLLFCPSVAERASGSAA